MNRDTIISIKGRPIDEPAKQDVVRPSRRRGFLARRLQPTGIRIFDTGWIKSGSSYINLPFVDRNASDPFVLDTTTGETTNDTSLHPYHFTDRDDLIFAVPQADWTTTFKQIDDAHTAIMELDVVYRGDYHPLTASSSEWQDGVLTVSGGSDDTFSVSWPIAGLLTNDLGYSKITATYDISAPSVDFVPGPSMDVFLVPDLRKAQPGVVIGHADLSSYTEVLDLAYIINPRDALFDPAHPYFGKLTNFAGQSWQISSTAAEYAAAYWQARYIQEYFPYRAIAFDAVGSTITPIAITPAQFADASMFPVPPTVPTTGTDTSWFLSASVSGVVDTGSLLGIVKKAGQYYYFWRL